MYSGLPQNERWIGKVFHFINNVNQTTLHFVLLKDTSEWKWKIKIKYIMRAYGDLKEILLF